jgi:hypothetical protein
MNKNEKECRKEIRFGQLRAESRGDSDKVMLRGYAAVFDEETEIFDFFYGEYNEVIRKGAFKRAISEKQDVRALKNHDENYVLGRTESGTLGLKEDDKGLAVEIDPPDAVWADDLLASVERGDIDQMSFGFIVKEEITHKNDDGEITLREIIDVDLFDVSVVTYPAYPQTEIGLRSITRAFYQPPKSEEIEPSGEHQPTEDDEVTTSHQAAALLRRIEIERLRD